MAIGVFSGPRSFGVGAFTLASSSGGDSVGIIFNADLLYVPDGYVSNTALSSSSMYNNQTFASLGVTPGTYICRGGLGYGTRTSRSSSEELGCPMAARQFLCSVSVCSAWLPCGASWVAKTDFVRS